MAERPVFIPSARTPGFVIEIRFSIQWASGFALVQKQKNIRSLHEAAAKEGYAPLLEISTKSEEKAGRHLSAFHLKVHSEAGEIPLECAFQGSKVFQRGGPYTDLYSADPKSAKRDPRLKESGRLIGFEFGDFEFPLQPTTIFYDWLYLNAVYPHRDWLKKRLDGEKSYAGFTDIEFNPQKSVNCQARSCALFLSLMQADLLEDVMKSEGNFINIISEHSDRRYDPIVEHSGQLSVV